jgi:hypothetical protein
VNTLWCSACEKDKFRGFFTPAQQKLTDGVRLCMQCQPKRNRKRHAKAGLVTGKGTPWRNDLFFPGSKVPYGRGKTT